MIFYFYFYNPLSINYTHVYEIKSVSPKKLKKLRRQGRLVHSGVDVYYNPSTKYIDTITFDHSYFNNMNVVFDRNIKGFNRKFSLNRGSRNITNEFDSGQHLLENGYKNLKNNGFYIVAKNRSEATKIKLKLNMNQK